MTASTTRRVPCPPRPLGSLRRQIARQRAGRVERLRKLDLERFVVHVLNVANEHGAPVRGRGLPGGVRRRMLVATSWEQLVKTLDFAAWSTRCELIFAVGTLAPAEELRGRAAVIGIVEVAAEVARSRIGEPVSAAPRACRP